MTLDDYLRQPHVIAARVAERAGISEGYLSRVREGSQNVTRDVIRRLVAATEGAVSADEIVFPHGSDGYGGLDLSSAGKAGEISGDSTAQVAA